MKKLFIHVGVGVSLLVLTCLTAIVFEAILNWLDKNGIVGGSWFGLVGDLEFEIAAVIILVLWLISLFGLMTTWHSRFYTAAKLYVICVLGMLILGTTGVGPIGFTSSWFYRKTIWPIGAIFRLVELVYCFEILSVLAMSILGMVRAMFTTVTAVGANDEEIDGWAKLLIKIMIPFPPHEFICIYPRFLLDVIRWSLVITATIAIPVWLWNVHWILGILGIIVMFPLYFIFLNFFGFLTLPFYIYTKENLLLNKQLDNLLNQSETEGQFANSEE